MKLIVRMMNAETKRYRKVYDVENSLWCDTQHFPDELHGVPVTVDSVIFDNHYPGRVWLNLTPAWNKKRKAHDKTATTNGDPVPAISSSASSSKKEGRG